MNFSNVVRTLALFFIATVTVMNVSAQSAGDKAVGGYLAIGMGEIGNESFNNVGIGAKFQYNITDPIRLEGALTLFLKKDNVSMWDMSAYGHYLFNVADKLTVYPLVGLGVYGWKTDLGDVNLSDSKFAFTFGGGLDYVIANNLSLNAELKYKLVEDMNRFVISAGVTYKF